MNFYLFTNDNELNNIENLDIQQQYNYRTTTTIFTKSLDFPTEILRTIISFIPRSSLPQLAIVNKHWHIVTCPILYQNIYIRTTYHWQAFLYSINVLKSPWVHHITSLVLKPSPKLLPKSVAFHRHRYATDEEIERQGYIRLSKIDFDNTGLEWLSTIKKSNDCNNIMEDDVDVEVEVEENYKELDTTLKEAEWLTKVKDIDMAYVIEQCYQLNYLKLSGCTNVGRYTMYALASLSHHPKRQHHHSLKGLWIDLVRNITIDSWMAWIQNEKNKVINKDQSSSLSTATTALTHLDLSFCGFVTDTCLTTSLPMWSTTLTDLRLNSLYDITDNTVQAIALHCPQLTLLHLVRCWKITNQYFTLLATHCQKLKYFSLAFLNQVNEQGIQHVVLQCRQLAYLDISGTGISPMFKPMILKQWDEERKNKQWKQIHYQEDPVLLL
ncbi:hypothetical protein BJ944DRAFT_266432 [Cunninghamella echinulata]|nr:hypothetical protein BJ944DRAFT_266432 [Cunninghamella echinulata]